MPKSTLAPTTLMIASLLTAGCASNQPPYQPPVDRGYRVQITQGLEAAPDNGDIYFQQGTTVRQAALDDWLTHCRLELSGPDPDTNSLVSVAPDQFNVTDVKLRYQSSAFPYYGIQAGDTLIGFGLTGHRASPEYASRRDEPPASYLYRVEMNLSSADQPGVRTLTCSRKWKARGPFYPTLDDIREALGESIEIGAAI